MRDITRTLKKIHSELGERGHLITKSKTVYRWNYPKNVIIFNCNIVDPEHGVLWYGDIDVTEDMHRLLNIGRASTFDIYLMYEKDMRSATLGDINFQAAVFIVTPGRTASLVPGEVMMNHVEYSREKQTYLMAKETMDTSPVSEKDLITNRNNFVDLGNEKVYYAAVVKGLDKILGQSVKTKPPLTKLYEYVVQQSNTELTGRAPQSVEEFVVTSRLEKKLAKIVVDWSNRHYGHMHPCKEKQSLQMYWLDQGPAVCDNELEDIIYFRELKR